MIQFAIATPWDEKVQDVWVVCVWAAVLFFRWVLLKRRTSGHYWGCQGGFRGDFFPKTCWCISQGRRFVESLSIPSFPIRTLRVSTRQYFARKTYTVAVIPTTRS